MKEYVHFEQKDGIATVTIDIPETRNALSVDSAPQIANAFYRCTDDPAVRCVVLRGAGGNFCGGGDIKAMKARNDSGHPDNPEGFRAYTAMIQSILNCTKPVIAMIEGACAGAGVSLAMACDLTIAAEDVKFALSFVNVGYIPDMGASAMVTRSVGRARAARLILLGERFTGKDACAWGLISHAVPAEELAATVEKIAHRMANGPTVAYGCAKMLINRAQLYGMESCMQLEAEYQAKLSYTQDHYESVDAFLQKRKPNYVGS